MFYRKTSNYLFLVLIIITSISSCNSSSKTRPSEVNSLLVDTTWLLESIGSDKIIYPADYKQNFIKFASEAEGFKFSGFAGCNNIYGKYDVGDHGEINIDEVISTKITCSFIDLENNFISMLKEATSYKIEGYYLTFYSGDKKISSFKNSTNFQNQ